MDGHVEWAVSHSKHERLFGEDGLDRIEGQRRRWPGAA